jgi:hypothetical protein
MCAYVLVYVGMTFSFPNPNVYFFDFFGHLKTNQVFVSLYQGDQIGRIFAHWETVNFEQFF